VTSLTNTAPALLGTTGIFAPAFSAQLRAINITAFSTVNSTGATLQVGNSSFSVSAAPSASSLQRKASATAAVAGFLSPSSKAVVIAICIFTAAMLATALVYVKQKAENRRLRLMLLNSVGQIPK